MNSLVVLGSTAAWAYSVVVTFLPGLMPEGTANVYFEASAVIVTLILLGRLLEAWGVGGAGAHPGAPHPAGGQPILDRGESTVVRKTIPV